MQNEDIFCTEFLDESSSQVSKGKRSRSTNFTSQEEDVLMSLVEKYSHVLESKKTNAVSWQQKNEVWEKISMEFGAQCQIIRTSKNLRDKYENIKRKAKISISNDRNQFYKTGGGIYCSKVSNNDERVNALLGKSATGLFNENDCDTLRNQDEDACIEIDFLEEQDEPKMEQKESLKKLAEENGTESHTWSSWNPIKLKSKKAGKLNFKNHASAIKSEDVAAKQATFFENEDKRAEERHKLQVQELNLKAELLQLEINLKKIEIEKLNLS